MCGLFQSTPPMRGATTNHITAPQVTIDFNPRPPCGERRGASTMRVLCAVRFQSTPPMRGATKKFGEIFPIMRISIHAPHAGSDDTAFLLSDCFLQFQSTPPMRGATLSRSFYKFFPCGFQSTPPMRGATVWHKKRASSISNFNPRPPCGERLTLTLTPHGSTWFQSTPPMRGATWLYDNGNIKGIISIHAPHAGSDQHIGHAWYSLPDFNPRPPCGERQNYEIP